MTDWAHALNPLICANLAFVFYLTILYFIRILGVSYKIYFVFFFFLMVIVVANMTTSAALHEITYNTEESGQFDSEKRVSLEQYFQIWLDQRKDKIQQYLSNHQPEDTTQTAFYPVVLIASEGGGSRAAYWTNIVHHFLDEKINGFYDQHLFAMTGASGGNTGNSTYFAMKQAGIQNDSIPFYAQKMFMGNFLSSSLTLLLGTDLWQSTFGINLKSDRANLLGNEWKKQLEKVSHQEVSNYDDPFLSFWYEPGSTKLKQQETPPLLVINTTHVQEGGHAVISPVEFNSLHYNALDLIHAVDTMSDGKKTIPLNTAVLLNASFPYINPAGNISNVGSFVDAGYYDNYGAEIGEGILKHLKYFRDSMSRSDSPDAELYKQLQFLAVLVRNGTVDPTVEASPASSQLIAPASTIANLRKGFNTRIKWDLEKAADPTQYYIIALPHRDSIKIIVPGEEDPISPIVPLARYLSTPALVAMDTGLIILQKDVQSDLNRLIKTLN